MAVVAAAALTTYSAYAVTAHSPAMLATVPFVVFGIFRYLLLMHRDDLGEEPEAVLLSDAPLLVTVALWALVAAAIVALR